MRPTIEPGDWLLVDPTVCRWPRRGSIVVIREPGSGELAIKRVAGRPGDWVPFQDGYLHLRSFEAWLLADADPAATAEAGYGPPIDSRRYGPVPIENLVARAWFRYAPIHRLGWLRDPRRRTRPPSPRPVPPSSVPRRGEPQPSPPDEPMIRG